MATRFYGWENGTSPLGSLAASGTWTNTASLARRPMHTVPRAGDSLATTAMSAPTAGQIQIYRQWVSAPMAAGNAFVSGTTSFKAYFQVLESATNDNLFSRCGIRIVSEDGLTVRATLKAVADYSTATEWNTSLRSKAFLDGDTASASYTTVDGDRLVFEFGSADASGASILGSLRTGSNAASANTDLAENETDTTTTKRGWFECSLDIAFRAPTVVNRYVDTASTAGGDGTTSATSGANRAFVSLAAAFSAIASTDWATANQQVTINCGGSGADASCATGTITGLTPTCFVRVLGNATSALVYDTSKYRVENATGSGGCIFNNGCTYLAVESIQAKHTISSAVGGRVTFNVDGPVVGWSKYDRCHVWGSIVAAQVTTIAAFGTSATAGITHTLIVRNCCIHDYIGAGATHIAFNSNTVSTASIAAYNNTVYNCGNGFVSNATNILAKNNGVTGCTDGYAGTFVTGSTNNASDLSGDAPGTNARNSVTPTFVNLAGGDFHLASSDTAWLDHGADLSGDANWPFSTDGDGDTRSGTWDIGADEYVASGTLYTQTVDGTLTTAGAIVLSSRKIVAGTLTTGGVLPRQARKVAAGTLTTAGVAVRRAAKTPAGTLASAGAVSANKTARSTVSGTLSTTGAIVKRANKIVAGTLSTAGAIVKQANKIAAGTLTTAGAIVKQARKVLAGTLATAGAVVIRTSKGLAGTLTTSGAIVNRLSKLLDGTLVTSGALIRRVARSLAGMLAPTGDLSKRTGKTVDGTLSTAGIVTTIKVFTLTVAGTLTTAGALSRQVVRTLDGALTTAGTLIRQTTKTFAGAFTPAGDLIKRTSKTLVGTLASSGALTASKLAMLSLAGTLTTSGAIVVRTAKTLAGTLSTAGALTMQTAKSLAGTLSTSGSIVKSVSLTVSGTLSSAATIVIQIGKTLSGALATAGALTPMKLANFFTKTVDGTLASAGALVRRTQKTVDGTLVTAGSITRSMSVSLSASLTTAGALSRRIAKTAVGALSTVGALVAQRVSLVSLSGTLTTSGSLTRQTKKILAATLATSGTITRYLSRVLVGTLATAGNVSRRSQRSVAGNVAVAGSVATRTSKEFSGVLAMAGSAAAVFQKILNGLLDFIGSLVTAGNIQPTIDISADVVIHDSIGLFVETLPSSSLDAMIHDGFVVHVESGPSFSAEVETV